MINTLYILPGYQDVGSGSINFHGVLGSISTLSFILGTTIERFPCCKLYVYGMNSFNIINWLIDLVYLNQIFSVFLLDGYERVCV